MSCLHPVIEAATLGECWLAVSKLVLETGATTLTDTSYIPCVSLLDFWVRDGAVELVVYAHSLDFGKKAYGNLVELALLQQRVGDALGRPTGMLTIHVKSAHIYEPEFAAMTELVLR